MPRFVLLRHECPSHYEKPSHWDFMLAWDGVLRTWDLRELPAAWAIHWGQPTDCVRVTALPLPDHRSTFLDFEGPLTGERGSVRCCDRGTYELLSSGADALSISLTGAFLQGTVRLARQGQTWSLEASEGIPRK